MRHQAQKGFSSIFVGIPQYQEWYLVYVPSTSKIISLHDIVFDESFSSVLAYMSRHYYETMAICLSMIYTTRATYSREKTGNIITFTHFEEGNILYKNS